MVAAGQSLAGFFEIALPLLLGGPTPESVSDDEQRAGLAFYRHMTELELRNLLHRACPGVARALELLGDDSFARLSREYFRAHPPRGWDPGAVADSLPSFLIRTHWPRALSEIAEIHQLLRQCALAAGEADSPFEHTIFVRRFETTSPRFVQRLLASEPLSLPEEEPMVAIIYRSHRTQRSHLLLPSEETLRALLAYAQRRPPPPAGMRVLLEVGVLSPVEI